MLRGSHQPDQFPRTVPATDTRSCGSILPEDQTGGRSAAFDRFKTAFPAMVHYGVQRGEHQQPFPPSMKFGVVIFPGSNCDHDALYALSRNLGQSTSEIWHESEDLGDVDAVFLPGGFSYGDYLRCGAIARFSPVIRSVRKFARAGGLVLGVCNGFQILVEAGLLPGVLMRNQGLRFVCRTVELVPGTNDSAFTSECRPEEVLRIPVAHGEGCYFADEATLDRLEAEDRIAFRYHGHNPNGSRRAIAGVLSEGRNVLGMMPHPERACDAAVGSTDGIAVFRSIIAATEGVNAGHAG